MRKLATVRKILTIDPIEGADSIEVATVGGWKVVVKKGQYQVGDLVIYCEIDSWIPTDLAPFLSNGKEPREYNGVKGERLRTVKLRGQISQGLLLSGTICHTGLMVHRPDSMAHIFKEDDDVSEWLNIQKWEAPVPAQLAGVTKGSFPSFIPKTDQERIQNLVCEIEEAAKSGALFEVTEKLEGSSMTCFLHQGVFGVCSRNLELKQDSNNTFWATAIKLKIEEKMKDHDEFWDFAIQGELVGPGIQGNIYKLTEHNFFVYDVYDIQAGKYMNSFDRNRLVKNLGLSHVPVIGLYEKVGSSIDTELTIAEGKSTLNPKQEREGIVYKQLDKDFSFKVISNRYLLK